METELLEKFNCNVMIVNKTNQPLILSGKPVNTHGDYSPAPPNEIPPKESANFTLKHTNWSPYGTEGSCQYSCAGLNGRALIEFSYICPSGTGYNATDAIIIVGTGVNIQMIPNPLPQSGHPVNVQFIIS